jgi:MoxR-like ATPase
MSCDYCTRQSAAIMTKAGVTPAQTGAIFERAKAAAPAFRLGKLTTPAAAAPPRVFAAPALNSIGQLHCRTCGRYVPASGSGHICPYTGTLDQMGAAIARRTGLPAAAFGDGYIEAMMKAARENEVVLMRHPVTGDAIHATLDAIPLAMATGYHSDAWRGFKGDPTYSVASGNGQVYQLLTPPHELGLKPVAPTGAVAGAAAAYGHIPVTAPVSAAAAPAPIPAVYALRVGPATELSGGSDYTMGRVMGSEFRKAKSAAHKGEPVAGGAYQMGDVDKSEPAKSLARRQGFYADSSRGIVAGRTFVEATYLLTTGQREAVLTPDGLGAELYEMENGNRGALRAVFSAAGSVWTAGDVEGSANMSAEQVAAMAGWLAHPSNPAVASALNSPSAANYLAADLEAAGDGRGTHLAASDSIYVALQTIFEGAESDATVMRFGGEIATPRCPACGQWMGSSHLCQAASAAPSPPAAEAAPSYAIEHRGSWTWIKFADSPPEDVRQAITDLGFNYKSAEQAWYTRGKISEGDLDAAVKGAPAVNGAGPATPAARAPKRRGRKGAGAAAASTAPTPSAPPQTAQEFIMSGVVLAAPDAGLRNVPADWGGQLARPLAQKVPSVNAHYQVDQSNEHVWAAMSASLQVAAQVGGDNRHSAKFRSFGLYGSPAAGKNELARQLAASIKWQDSDGQIRQGINYSEVNVTEKSSADEVIGGAILESVDGATRSRVALGPVGQAAAMGSVIAVNEIVRNPKLATAFQSMIEDGEIIINTPEAGTVTIPVHPSTVFVFTWNPGYEGDADRPGLAALSRMTTFRMEEPNDEQVAARVDAFFNDLLGDDDSAGEATTGSEARQAAVKLRKNYRIPPKGELMPTTAERDAATKFWSQLRAVAGPDPETRRLGFKSLAPTAPRQRDLVRFIALGKAIGWKDAVRMFDIVCDQDEDFAAQRAVIDGLFEQNFGRDGKALHRARV